MSTLSASKQKRLAKKQGKKTAENGGSTATTSATASPVPTNGTTTPITNVSANNSSEDLNGAVTSMQQLRLLTDRSATGVLASRPESRDIKIEQYSLSFHGRVLVENATIEFNYGQRYGLLGANGSGKSTFLASLANRDVPIPEAIDIYLLDAEAEPTEIDAITYIIQSATKKVEKIENDIEKLSLAEPIDEIALEQKYEQLEELDPNTFESRAAAILNGLGFDQTMMKKPTKDMSGGWRMRVALGKALFIKPTLLLLDEPTNHLDLEAVVWLESYLSTYNHILVIVSHSQDFLNSVCTNIMDLTMSRKLVYYGGNFDTYIRTKEELETNQMKAYAKQQDEIQHIKKFIASAGTYANLVKQAKSKQKIIDKMEAAGLVEQVEKPHTLKWTFPEVRALPPPIIAFNEVAFSYNGKMKDALYKDLNFGVDMDSRIALVGRNGTGKSTLVNLMLGQLQPIRGSISRHTQLKTAKYSQHSNEVLPAEETPLDYLMNMYKEKYNNKDPQFYRQQLGRFGISGSHQTSPIKTLSDGLKSRIVFAQLAMEAPHLLFLDEPTNCLDIASIDALGDAIRNFNGGVVLVSHDFRLIEQCANELWEVIDRSVNKLDMDIKSYKQSLMDLSADSIAQAKNIAKTI